MGLLQKVEQLQQAPKTAKPTAPKLPKSVSPAKKEVTKGPSAAKPALKTRPPLSIKPEIKKPAPSLKKEEVKEEKKEEKAEPRKPEHPQPAASRSKVRIVHIRKATKPVHHIVHRKAIPEYAEEEMSMMPEKSPEREEVKVTPLPGVNHGDKFFLLKIGSFVTSLGRRRKEKEEERKKEEKLEEKTAAKIAPEEKKELPKKKKKHRLRLLIMLVIIAVILEMLILTVLNRLGIVDLTPWQGPIVSSFIWLGQKLIMYGKPLTTSVNWVITSSFIGIVLLLFVAIIYIRRVRRHKKEQAVAAAAIVMKATALAQPAKEMSKEAAKETKPMEESALAQPEEEGETEEKAEEEAVPVVQALEVAKTKELPPAVAKSESYTTEIDELYNYIQTVGKITLTEVGRRFNLTKDLAEDWAKILEGHELITIEYPIFSSPILTKYKPPEEEEE